MVFSGQKKRILEGMKKVLKKDFSESTNNAINNSTYQFSTTLMSKVFSLIFTIVAARILLPELFGLYSLALSTILLFVAFSDLGIGETLVRFVSREIGRKNPGKAKAYAGYFIRMKFVIMTLVFAVLLLSAKYISEGYYHKPIYLALVAGAFYMFFSGIAVMLHSVLQAHNLFKPIFLREFVFQVIRVATIPFLVLFMLERAYSNEVVLMSIMSVLAATSLISSIFLYTLSKKRVFDVRTKKIFLSRKDKRHANRFVIFTSAIILSGIFFGYIDTIMLGYFVSSEYIGYYQAAFSFMGAVIPLMSFSAALLPVFSRMKRKKMRLLLKQAVGILSVISIAIFVLLFTLSNFLVYLVFGGEYAYAAGILKIFAFLVLSLPVITIYPAYFASLGKPGIVSRLLVISTIANITLNYILISNLISYGQIYAVYGAAIATITSRYIYMFMLIIARKKN